MSLYQNLVYVRFCCSKKKKRGNQIAAIIVPMSQTITERISTQVLLLSCFHVNRPLVLFTMSLIVGTFLFSLNIKVLLG